MNKIKEGIQVKKGGERGGGEWRGGERKGEEKCWRQEKRKLCTWQATVIGKTFPKISGVGHIVWAEAEAEAEAAFFWPNLLPTITTRFAYTVLPTSRTASGNTGLVPTKAGGLHPGLAVPFPSSQRSTTCCGLWAFTIFSDNLPLRISSKGLIDTSMSFRSSSNIVPKGLFPASCHQQYYFSGKFLRGAAF